MRVAFYAPLKPPSHPVPSGDRRMARLMMKALVRAGHTTELMAAIRAYCKSPDLLPVKKSAAMSAADRLSLMLQARPYAEQPEAWLTYHLYYKAPDWIGPVVATALDIPYVVAEASSAPKRLSNGWAEGQRAVETALGRADAILSLNPADDPAVEALLDRSDRINRLLPFLDGADPIKSVVPRHELARRWDIPEHKPWLLVVAMMRDGDKLASYQMLGASIAQIADLDWHLVVAGDGPARAQVAAALGTRATLLGACDQTDLALLYANADLLVWPAINEAFGMALLEARAVGLPVVAGDQGAVTTIVEHERSGLVVSPPNAEGIAMAMRRLLTDRALSTRMTDYARRTTADKHGLAAAAIVVDGALRFAHSHRRRSLVL